MGEVYFVCRDLGILIGDFSGGMLCYFNVFGIVNVNYGVFIRVVDWIFVVLRIIDIYDGRVWWCSCFVIIWCVWLWSWCCCEVCGYVFWLRSCFVVGYFDIVCIWIYVCCEMMVLVYICIDCFRWLICLRGVVFRCLFGCC